MNAAPELDWRFVAALTVLFAIALVSSRAGRLGVQRDQAVAAARAVVQLAVVAAVLTFVLRSALASFGFVVLMLVVAG